MGRAATIVLPLIAAAVAPAVIAVALMALFSGDLTGASAIGLMVFIVAAAHVLLLGVPGFAFLYWRNWVRWWSLTALGFVAGCIPAGIVFWPPRYEKREYASSWQEDGVWTMIDGVPTLAGWLIYGKGIAWFGALGAVGALAFWFTRTRLMRSDKSLERTREE